MADLTHHRSAVAARGVLALTGILVFAVGIPAGNLATGGSPSELLPRSWPDATGPAVPEHLWNGLRWSYLDGSLVPWLAHSVVWCAWILGIVLIIIDIVRVLRRGVAALRRQVTASTPRGWVTSMVTAALILLATTDAHATTTASAPPVATAPQHPLHTTPTGTASASVPAPVPTAVVPQRSPFFVDDAVHPECPRVTAVKGDTEWGLAEYHLGDGRRDTQIHALNRDRIGDDPRYLLPGTILLLPPDATNLPDEPTDPGPDARQITVYPGETASSIAHREYGDPEAWRQLWEHNRNRLQPDGRAWRDPDLILSGWRLQISTTTPNPGMKQPTTSTAPPTPLPAPAVSPPVSSAPEHPPTTDAQTPQTTPTGTDTPTVTAPVTTPSHGPSPSASAGLPTLSTPAPPAMPVPHPGTAITVETGAFVGLGLAALITVALCSKRLWHRRHYRPGSGERADLVDAPIVRALRIAHDRATLPHDEDGALVYPQRPPGPSLPGEGTLRERALRTADAVLTTGDYTVVGLRDGQAAALDLAGTRGLGLVGPGAVAAVRAVLVALLADAQHPSGADVEVVIPHADLRVLLADSAVNPSLPRLRVLDSLDAALDTLEAALVSRTRHLRDAAAQATLVLLATPESRVERRLRAIIDSGAALGINAILLGDWPHGPTAQVHADGTVATTSSTVADALAGTRLFTLPNHDTTALLDLLGAAEQATQDTTLRGDTTRPGTVRRPGGGDRPDRQAVRAALTGELDPRQDPDRLEILDLPPTPTPKSGEVMTALVAPPHQVQITIPTADATSDPTAVDQEIEAAAVEDGVVADGGRRVETPLTLTVLGRLHLFHQSVAGRTDVADVLTPKQKEILLLLTLHADGVPRDTLTDAIWPDAVRGRAANTFHATLSRLRSRVAGACVDDTVSEVVVSHDGHYCLNRQVVTVDLWHLQDALTARRDAPTAQQRMAALQDVSVLYTGDLTDGVAASWLQAPREALRREVLEALGSLISAVGDDDPDRALALLERLRQLDRHNEEVYRAIIRIQARLGHPDEIDRTLAVLTLMLAEIDQTPSRDTVELGQRLQRTSTCL